MNSSSSKQFARKVISQSEKPATLQDAILLTLAFFDAQGMAISTFELWQNLIFWQGSYREVRQALESDPLLKKNLTNWQGFLSLRGEELIRQRLTNQKVSEMRLRRAHSSTKLLSSLPFVSSVSVVNTVAFGNASQHSDIDMFITVRPGYMWLTRLLANGLVQLQNRRKTSQHHANRICLSFFMTDDNLNLDRFAIQQNDYYLAFWLTQVLVIYQRPGFNLLAELNKQNEWAHQYFPQAQMGLPSQRRQISAGVLAVTGVPKWLGEKILLTRFGRWVESKVRAVQIKRMHKKIPYEHHTRTAHVVISDEVLKFHEEDKRDWFQEKTWSTYSKLKAGESINDSGTGTELPTISAAGMFVQPVGETISK